MPVPVTKCTSLLTVTERRSAPSGYAAGRMRGSLCAVVLCAVLGVAPGAHAEPWYRGPRGHDRVLHVKLATVAGLTFLASETVFKSALAADRCRWCVPPAIDVDVRRSLKWGDTDSAALFSTLTGYVAAPVFGIGLTALGALSSDDPSWGRLIDDTLPILETVAISQVVTQLVKFAVARERPFVHFGSPPPSPSNDDNLSFFSGHSALAFGIATSAGMVAHWNRSRAEPTVWAIGMTLAASTAYLRIAADRHYLTDVVAGSVVGVAAGLTIPRLLHRSSSVIVVPSGTGVAIAGGF